MFHNFSRRSLKYDELPTIRRSKMLSESDKIKMAILEQLRYGACYRIRLHRECCLELRLSIIPEHDEKGQRKRICKGIPDSRVDKIFKRLIEDGLIRKLSTEGTVYAFYELTREGRVLLK